MCSPQPVWLGVKVRISGAFPRGYSRSRFPAAGPIYCDLGWVLERLVSPGSLEHLVSGQQAARSLGWQEAPSPFPPQAGSLPHPQTSTPTHIFSHTHTTPHPHPHPGSLPHTHRSMLSHTPTHRQTHTHIYPLQGDASPSPRMYAHRHGHLESCFKSTSISLQTYPRVSLKRG